MTEAITHNDPDRFRLSEEQWITLCREFNLSHNEREAHTARIFNEQINWEEIADLNRFMLEGACAAFHDLLPSPAQQRQQFESFVLAANALLQSHKAIFDDIALNEVNNIFCEEVMNSVARVRDRAQSAAVQITQQKRRATRKSHQPLLESLCIYWRHWLFLPVIRSTEYSRSEIELFLIRVSSVVFAIKISPHQADHSIRAFNKEIRQQWDENHQYLNSLLDSQKAAK